ncbi:MAG: c-type cytochrome [Gemmataceae bacterium]|nr:c-type cytochrome [Gemmataceae bacterium]
MCHILSLGLLLIASSTALAQPPNMEPGPKAPADSLKCIQVRPGFTVELMAAEPLVMDPIAFAWGPDGKFWVVEMGDYPLGVDGKNKFGGKVKFLTKPKADGPYEKATVFLDNLGYPTGVTPWGKGVIVTCAPDIFYAEDTNGDGKADSRIVLFTGFREGNQQHRVNGLVWGLDNWLYGANGDSGGAITAVNALEPAANGGYRARKLKSAPGVNVSGRDFRLKPDTGEFEAVTGQTQFGRCRDDFGNWFGCNNSNPMFHFVLEDRYLKRNPHVLYPDPKVNVSVKPGAAPVFPISKPLPRFNSPQAVNHFTSACSVMIYRDDLFGPAFYGNSFVAEPVHNLVHREVMKPKGVTFTSQRADDEQTSEFLASSDNWFRPAMIATGPDGALWIADMYRYVIEHPEWIPLDWQKKLELRAGHDKGRIYRVYPKDKTPRAIPRMDTMKAKELVKALESANGWVRDMAQQRLLSNSLSGASMVEQFRPLLVEAGKKNISPAPKLQVLAVLGTYPGERTASAMAAALDDPHPAIRKYAVGWLWELTPDDKLKKLMSDADRQVRLQVAYSLADRPKDGRILATLLKQNIDDRFLTAAALSSVRESNWPEFADALLEESSFPAAVLPSVMKLATVYGKPFDVARLLAAQIATQKSKGTFEQMVMLAALLDSLDQNQSSLSVLAGGGKHAAALKHLDEVFAAARRLALDDKAAAGDKLLAIRLLGRGLNHQNEDRQLLKRFLSAQLPEDIQIAAVQRLGGIVDPRAAAQLIASWKSLSPTVRNHVVDVLLARVVWTRLVIGALEEKRILPHEIDTIRRQRFLDHRDSQIRETAAKLFAASSSPDRARLVSDYWITIPDRGDVQQGSKHFAKHCAACHQLGGIGQQVGPELAAVGDKSPQGLLTAILDPNRAVEARYVNYQATTKSGLTVSGLLQGETSTTITLVAADGKKHDLLRSDLDELTSTGKSVMPEGFEKELPHAAMADLIAFLRGNLAKPKSFAGNRPETVKAGGDGTLKLPATKAAIFGKTLVFEAKHKNLGYWSSADDQAVWTIDVAKEGRFDVWIDYACDSGSAGNTFALVAGDGQLVHKVRGTASWELYRKVKIGTLRLRAGRHDVVMRAEGAIRGALIDLRGIDLIPAKD